MSLLPCQENDTGWHIALGRLILDGRFPRTNALSWTTPDAPWYPTSWLYDVLSALAAHAPGALGVQVLTLAFFGTALTLAALACADEDPRAVWIGPFLAVLLSQRATARPHVATWTALAAVLLLGLRSMRAQRDALAMGAPGGETATPVLAPEATLAARAFRLRLLCLPILAVAGNLHAGAGFAAGLAGAFSLEAFLRTRRSRDFALGAAAPLMLLLNPGGAYNLGYLLENLRVNEVLRVLENEPPTLASAPMLFVLGPLVLALCALRFRDRLALALSSAALFVLSLKALRVAHEFELVSAPLLAWGTLTVLDHLALRLPRTRTWTAPALLLLAAAAGAQASHLLHRSRGGASFEFDERVLPVRAARFLAEHPLGPRGFTGLRDGGHLVYALRQPDFSDGRLQAFPPAFWRAFDQAEQSPRAFQDWLRGLGAEWALTTRIKERYAGFRLLDSPDWALVYWDTKSELFVRRDVPALAPVISAFEYKRFRPYGNVFALVQTLSPPEVLELERELDRFEQTSPQDPISAMVRCASASRLGSLNREEICTRALDLATEPPLQKLVQAAHALHP
ncbi:MAG: hypothetical protein JST92_18015 [Deltaproteobacteria bacterium]|nr:hypothetical protein [Deltaproteobacteria bacterium]